MPSPLIPLEALLNLRRLLDSLQTDAADSQQMSQVKEPSQVKRRSRLPRNHQRADESREQKNLATSFNSFNNIPR